MQSAQDWRPRFQQELEMAEAARLSGNEGMARVCARRAAGLVAGVYLAQTGAASVRAGAYERLTDLQEVPGLPPEVRAVVAHFLVRITPDHTLPVEADLITEARWLADQLLAE